MYTLVNTGPNCEISTTVYHNRTVGEALECIRNSIKEAGFYDDEDLAERERLVRDFIDIAKLLPDNGTYEYKPLGYDYVWFKMSKTDGRLAVDIVIRNDRDEVDSVQQLKYVDSNDYVN